jgi:tRNA-modifying protein YgfZ
MALLFDEPAVVRRDLGVVVVTGVDRLGYLHTLLSQHLEHAAAGTAADFLYLDAKGNIQAMGRALVRDDDVWLLTPRAVAGDLAAALEKYKFLLQVEAADCSDAVTTVSIRGPELPAGAPATVMTHAPAGAVTLVRDRSGGVDVVGPPDDVATYLRALDLPEAPAAAFDAWRIAAAEPAWGREVTPGRRAQELGLLPTHVHLRKGCYPGQESIAKIYNLGRPRRALAVLESDHPLSAGAAVMVGDKAGEVTSAAAVGDGSLGCAGPAARRSQRGGPRRRDADGRRRTRARGRQRGREPGPARRLTALRRLGEQPPHHGQRLGRLLLGLDLVEDSGDLPASVDDHRRADDAHELAPVHRLLTPCAVLADHLAVGVRQQPIWQLVPLGEGCVAVDVVR